MEKKPLYELIYTKLNKVTPLRRDCGLLCARACCQGSDHETLGMYLFPGEEVMFAGNKYAEDYFKIIQTDLEILSKSGKRKKVLLLTCEGQCDRNLRPLACRLFPLIPYLNEKDILKVKIDPRAKGICPLTQGEDTAATTKQFLSRVRKASQLLAKDEEVKDFIKTLSLLLDEYELDPLHSQEIQPIPDKKRASVRKAHYSIRLHALTFQ